MFGKSLHTPINMALLALIPGCGSEGVERLLLIGWSSCTHVHYCPMITASFCDTLARAYALIASTYFLLRQSLEVNVSRSHKQPRRVVLSHISTLLEVIKSSLGGVNIVMEGVARGHKQAAFSASHSSLYSVRSPAEPYDSFVSPTRPAYMYIASYFTLGLCCK